MKLHWLFGIHCLPIMVEELRSLIAPEELKNIYELSKNVGMPEDNFPDFLLVDNTKNKPRSSCLCYYKDGVPYVNKDSVQLSYARGTIKKLAYLVINRPQVIWPDYAIERIITCGLGSYRQKEL